MDAALNYFLKSEEEANSRLDGSAVEESHIVESDYKKFSTVITKLPGPLSSQSQRRKP